jgi:hypothetical protein
LVTSGVESSSNICKKKKRVLKIRQYLRLDQVMWIPGVLNPADAATRGLTVTKLKVATTWFSGPQFLYQQEDMWPQQPPEPGRDRANILPETITGLKKTRHGKINELLHVNQSNICLFAAIQV